jgi:hypothetical protein
MFLLRWFNDKPPTYFGYIPSLKPTFTLPLVPKALFFFSLILMIPALPDASYFADGLVMISIASMDEDWSVLRYEERSVPDNGVGRPSI